MGDSGGGAGIRTGGERKRAGGAAGGDGGGGGGEGGGGGRLDEAAAPAGTGNSPLSAHKRAKHSDSLSLSQSTNCPRTKGPDSGSLDSVVEGPNSPLADFTALSLLPSKQGPDVSFPEAEDPMAGSKAHGKPGEGERVGRQGCIRKVEYVRLLEQALYALGYNKAAEELERESMVPLETGQVASLRAAVMAGEWDESLRILRSLGDVTLDTLRHAKFLLQQQKFLELLEAGDTSAALVQLREHTAPLCGDRRRLHQLASWLMCSTREDLLARSGWPGKGRPSRLLLIQELQALLPPALMIPDRRLEDLLEQTLTRQEQDCTFHNYAQDSFSLFSDHDCGRDQIPSVTTQILEEHTDEVWYVQFSHDGTRLASASKDCRAVIWEVHDAFSSSVQHVLTGHTLALSFVAWSPDDSMLVTCGSDHLVKLWDTRTGQCLHTYRKHSDPVTACAWFPCGRRFVSVGPVKSGSQADKSLYCWDIEGNEVLSWLPMDGVLPQHLQGPRINDVAISYDGKLMVTICSEQKIVIHNMETGAVRTVAEPRSVTSLSMSLDSHFALVNISNGYIHLWDLEAVCQRLQQDSGDEKPSSQYKGQVQGRFVIRSCFGGSHQSFIVSGSEDSQVYIWHRPSGEILHVLPGHAGTVNAVSWPATRPLMFASASDDRTVRIWGLRAAQANSMHGACNGVPHQSKCNGIQRFLH